MQRRLIVVMNARFEKKQNLEVYDLTSSLGEVRS